MSYRINARAKKNGGYSWGLIFEDWQQGKRIDRRIKAHDLLQYGFRPDMSVEEARGRAKQLNAETKFKRRGEKDKIRALQSAELEKRFVSKHFPQTLVEEFERTRLKKKFEFGGDKPEEKYKKALSRWRFARVMVIALDLLPSDWEEEPRQFYKYFSDKAISLDYAGKIIHILNLWGHFVSKKQGRPFLPIPAPRGYDRQSIADAYHESLKRKKVSAPLAPETLESNEIKFSPEQFNWLWVSIWLGLRPSEIDQLKPFSSSNRFGYKIEEFRQGRSTVKVLKVYQSKLTTLSQADRWKSIPIIYPEQKKALKIIQSKPLKRPLTKTIQKYLGDDLTLYAGRKGFTDLMIDKGQDLKDISMWLGHTSVDQTWKSYKNKNVVRFTPVTQDGRRRANAA